MWMALAATGVAGIGGTGLGGGIACLMRRDSPRMVSLLLSFAAGVMTAVVCCDLLGEAVGAGERGLLFLTAAAVLMGHGAVEGLEALLERRQPQKKRNDCGRNGAGGSGGSSQRAGGNGDRRRLCLWNH